MHKDRVGASGPQNGVSELGSSKLSCIKQLKVKSGGLNGMEATSEMRCKALEEFRQW